MWPTARPSPSGTAWCFSALTLGFFDVALSSWRLAPFTASFSALTLGFFDVADLLALGGLLLGTFQCPNAGLLRCGFSNTSRSRWDDSRFSALTLGFFDVASSFGQNGLDDVQVSVP